MTAQETTLDLNGNSVLIFDDGLRSLNGHFYEYDLAVARHHLQRGARVTLICHKDFSERDAFEKAGAKVLPLIGRSYWWEQRPKPGRIREIAGYLRQGLHYARILLRHLRREPAYDLVFIPNAMVADALAWSLVVRLGLFSGIGRLVFLYWVTTQIDMDKPVARKFAIWHFIFRSHRRHVSSRRIAYLTDSSRSVKEYELAAGIHTSVTPSPRTLPVYKPRTNRGTEDTLTFAMVGYATWGRGFDLFDRAIELLVTSGRAKGLHFILQWHTEFSRPDGTPCHISRFAAESEQVTIIDKPLSSEDYAALFDGIDCMVLPYRKQMYRSQTSGVAIEAACADIPLIYTEDTWVSDLAVEQAAGLSVPNEDVTALADAIAALASSYGEYAAKARASGARARAFNSPENFLRQLWTA